MLHLQKRAANKHLRWLSRVALLGSTHYPAAGCSPVTGFRVRFMERGKVGRKKKPGQAVLVICLPFEALSLA